jgi:RNA polymerase sigma-70 factor (ECF subfamily)
MENKELYTKIFKKYSADVYRYAYSLTKSKAKAEDIVSSTFEKLLKKKDIKEELVKFWLFTVARNEVYKNHRDKIDKIQGQKQISDISEEKITVIDELIEEQTLEIIKEELFLLDQHKREVLILRLQEEMKFKDIAEFLQEKLSTVKLRFYRALEELKQKIAKREEGERRLAIIFPMGFELDHIATGVKQLSRLEEFNYSASATDEITDKLNLSREASAMETKDLNQRLGLSQSHLIGGLAVGGVVMIGLIYFVIAGFLSDQGPVVDDNPESTAEMESYVDTREPGLESAPEENSEEIESPTESETASTPVDFAIKGMIGLDGSATQADFFDENPCKIIDSQTKEVITSCESVANIDNILNDRITITPYGYLLPGNKDADGQYFIMYASEGGDTYILVYRLDRSGKVTLIENKEFGIGMVASEIEEKNQLLASYGISDTDIIIKDSEYCDNRRNSLTRECVIYQQ